MQFISPGFAERYRGQNRQIPWCFRNLTFTKRHVA